MKVLKLILVVNSDFNFLLGESEILTKEIDLHFEIKFKPQSIKFLMTPIRSFRFQHKSGISDISVHY